MLLLDRDYKNVAKREIDTELYQKASSASLAEIKALVEAGANPDAPVYPYMDVLDFLLENGADLNEGACGSLPLEMAVRKGSVERVKYFIEHGSRIDWVESYEIAFAPMENVRLLLEHGYDPNMMDEEEGTKVIDHLDPKRQALFREFGGVVLKPDAEKYYLTYPEEMPKE